MTAKLLVPITSMILMLSGCNHFSVATSETTTTSQPQILPSNSPILATISNLNVLPSATLGNTAVLIKDSQNFCTIEFTGFYDIGKVVEKWAFRNNQLLSASTTKIIYQNTDRNTAVKASQSNAVPFDITLPEKIENFHNLKNNFSKEVLQHCNS